MMLDCVNVMIKLLDESHAAAITWILSRAWLCRVKWGSLKALENEVLMEELVLTHEGLTMVNE